MNFMKRIFRRKLEPIVSERIVRTTPGPLTAIEAFEMALAEAQALDPRTQLILVTSGTDIQANGRSFVWEFLFGLEARKGMVMVSLFPDINAPDVESAAVHVKRRIQGSDGKSFVPLPFEFRDSPEVVAELSAAGVDFVAGPTDMKLESGFSADGKAVWITYCWKKRYEASFG